MTLKTFGFFRLHVLLFLCSSPLLSIAQKAAAPTAQLNIDTGNIVSPVSPVLYGLMTEEINHSYDGGLYAELVRNPTMRNFWSGVEGWELVRNGNADAEMMQDKEAGPSSALPTSLKLVIKSASAKGEAGVSNSGYWGIGVHARTT